MYRIEIPILKFRIRNNMDIRICPDCNKVFYVTDEVSFPVCNYCGHALPEKRWQERIPAEIDFVFHFRNENCSATLMDFSKGGARIAYAYEKKHLLVGNIIDINVEKIDIHAGAMAVWTKKQESGTKVETGLKFISRGPERDS